MNTEKIYLQGAYVKEVPTQYSPEIKTAIKFDEFVESLRPHVNEKGWVNIKYVKRREPNEKGNTHYVTLDNYVKQEIVGKDNLPS